MKVLIVSGSMPPLPCGVGDYTARLARSLAANPGIDVAVLTTGAADSERVVENRVEILSRVPDWRLSRLARVLRIVRAQAPDLVHIQYPTRGYGRGLLPSFLPLALALSGWRVIQTWHEEFRLRHLPEFLLKALVPSGLVVVRPEFRQNLPRPMAWLLRKRQLRYIRNGSVFEKIEMAEEARSRLRTRYLKGQSRLVVYFGFVLPGKGAELLFEIANAESDHVVIAGTIAEGEMQEAMHRLSSQPPWRGRSTLTGFLAATELAELLAVADAVVLPFRAGGGEWNSSIHAALAQGTLVVTTSGSDHGYDARRNIYFSRVDDVAEMRAAVDAHAGTRVEGTTPAADWAEIAGKHVQAYGDTLARKD